LFFPVLGRAHEIVGEVTPLMIHMRRTLILIEKNKYTEALSEAKMVYGEFSHSMGMGIKMKGEGLKKTAMNIDRRFGTHLARDLDDALDSQDALHLQKVIYELSFLLMMEKFETLESTFDKATSNLAAQKTIFWLGRNYFSYILEPVLVERDPVETKRLDRLLDSMLYRLEDGQIAEFKVLLNRLVQDIMKDFHMDIQIHVPSN